MTDAVTYTLEVRREANVSAIYRVIGETLSDEQKVRLCNCIGILFATKFLKIIRPVLVGYKENKPETDIWPIVVTERAVDIFHILQL
jgi:hypothetical protein